MPEFMRAIVPDRPSPDRGAIRLFFQDERTGGPITGMAVSFFADSRGDVDSPAGHGRHLATLQTDQAGYVSFKFDRSMIASGARLTVAPGTSHGETRTFGISDLLAGGDVHTIRLDASALVPVSPHTGLPSVVFPDVEDVLLSPGSIGAIPQLWEGRGRGLCSQLMPTMLGIRRFRAFQIVADLCHPQMVSCSEDEVVSIVEGRMLEYEIAWHPAGTALGDLLNTITLAPCEQVNIAVVDWMRRETAMLDQAVDVQQSSFQQMDHDRLISETMQSSVKSSAWAIGGFLGVKAPIAKGKIDLTAMLGGGVGKSSSAIAGATTSALSEQIRQSASFVASQRNSSVFQATAAEHRIYQTRTIRNHNHCRTLSLMYYQVNRSYQVVTDYRGERKVILVRYPVRDFGAERAYCNAEVLKDALLDPSLRGCFDELADALFCCEAQPSSPTTPPSTQPLAMDLVRLVVDVKDIVGIVTQVSITLYSANGTPLFNASVGGTGVASSAIWHPGMQTNTFPVNYAVDPQMVASVRIDVATLSNAWNPPPPPQAMLNKVDVAYHVAGQTGWFSLLSLQGPTTVSTNWQAPAAPQLPTTQPSTTPSQPAATGNECIEKSCCIKKLLGHLNCHKRYYNRVLWLSEDPDERIMRWSCCFKGLQQFDLVGQIGNDPVAVHGDYLVFPIVGSPLVDDPAILPVRELVTMPTPGVYAEGILGQCDTCETIDPDRFRDWKDSPCVDCAPAVDDPPEPQQGAGPGDLKPDLISNLITFSSVPGTPESVLKDLISALVANADGGSSEAKALLDKLLDTIKEGLKPSSADKPSGSGSVPTRP